MSYLSLYRKYRSQTFGDLVGQEHVVRTLQNGIASGRIAHAYLFTGPRGTGKTSTARLLAKALCCETGPSATPDNTCEICTSITLGNCMDVIEMDAASEAGVEDIREKIVEVVQYQPMVSRYKVFIIDEVHDLSGKAFDALLKTIEEPPPHIIFILATTEYNKVPATIRSRCQKHEFHRASMADLVGRLQYVAAGEEIEVEPPAMTAMARMADGGYRDALTLLEQAILTAEDGKVTLTQVYDQLGLVSDEIVDGLLMAIRNAEVAKIIELLAEVFRLGRDPRAILESLLYRLADLTRAAYGVDSGTSDAAMEASLHETAAHLGRDRLLSLRSALSDAHRVIRDISLPRVWLESILVQIAAAPTKESQTGTADRQIGATPKASPKPELKPASSQTQAAPPKTPMKEPVATISEPAPVVDATPPGTGNDELDAAILLWRKVVAELPPNAAIGIRLGESTVAGVEKKWLNIQLKRKTDVAWIEEVPGRQAFVQKALDKHGGSGWQVKYTADSGPATNMDVAAVELPAEGARLEKMAKEILAPPNENEL